MSDLRRDPTTDGWVIIAPERGRRPREGPRPFKRTAPALRFNSTCPFCPGNEAKLPAIIDEMPSTQKPGWRTRVAPNKFPAVSQDIARCRHGPAFYETAAAQGHHEVVIESPRHDNDLAMMSEQEVRDVLVTYRSRYEALIAERAVHSVIVFRNHGVISGASLRHPHSQVIALNIVPALVRIRQAAMLGYYQKERRCILCDIVVHERGDGSRVVTENDAFLTVVPLARRIRTCEMWLIPKRHQADFGDLQNGRLPEFCDRTPRRSHASSCRVRRSALQLCDRHRCKRRIGSTAPALAPAHHAAVDGSRRLESLGSGLAINPSLPEEDAIILRSFRPFLKETC